MKLPNTPWATALIIALLYSGVLFLQLSIHNQDPSYFIRIGDVFITERGAIPRYLYVIPNSTGYDGQFYYQLARNPFNAEAVNSGFWIDNGPYRNQRILYPLLVWVFSLGDSDNIPAMLLIFNYLGLCILAWLSGQYARLHGAHVLWGVIIGLFPGFLFTLTHDLTEILAAVFLLAAILVLEFRPSKYYVALLLILSILTRETAVIAVIAIGIGLVVERKYALWPSVVIPIAVYLVWQIYLWSKWGEPPVQTVWLLMGTPGSGMLPFLGSLDPADPVHRIWIIELLYLALIAITALAAWRNIKGFIVHKAMWLGFGLMLVSLSPLVWIADYAFLRTAAEFTLLGLLLILNTSQPRLMIPAAVGTIATWTLVCFTRLY